MSTARVPKPAILGRIPTDRHVVIEASAGTGKTFTLENLLVELLLTTETTLDQILVVTFTEKATGELRLRVRQKLESLLAAQDDGETPENEPCWTIDSAARERLSRALLSLDQASISTIHAFCQRVLTEHAFANGRLFDEGQVEASQAFSAAFKDALRSEFARDPQQSEWLRAWLEAGESVEGLEHLLATCGRERGTLEPELDAAAFERAFLAFRIDGPTLDLLAAEWKGRLKGQTPPACRRKLAALEAVIAAGQDASVPRKLALLAEWREKPDPLAYLLEKLSEVRDRPQTAKVLAQLAELQRTAVEPAAALVHHFLPRVQERLRERKRALGLFDFDDMLQLVFEGLRGPGGAMLIALLRARYRYALIDEFQDTDDVQWGIFRKLFFESPDAHRLYLVGDPKQAIYRFRGADVYTYLAAKAEVQQAGGALVSLEQNFRSTSEVIAGYNAVFDQSANPPYFTGDGRYDHPVSCGKTELALTDSDGLPQPALQLLHVVAKNRKVNVEDAREALGRQIAREIRQILGLDGRRLFFGAGKERRPVQPRDIFLLTKDRHEGVRLGEALRAAGVPFAFYKQDGLFQTEEAEHVRDVLAAVADPTDRAKRLRAWLTPFFGLTLDELAQVRELPPGHPLAERLERWHQLAADQRYEELFARLQSDSGIVRRELFQADGERALTNYQHLFELLLAEARRTPGPIGDLVQALRAFIENRRLPAGESGNVQRLESERDAVQIMTMHKSKGLEAVVVFVAGGLSEGNRHDRLHVYHRARERRACIGEPVDPQVRQLVDAESEEEDQRLLYVALTRAKGRLYLPYFGPPDDDTRRQLAASEADELVSYKPKGCYAVVAERLQRLVTSGDPAANKAFPRIVVDCDEPAPEPRLPAETLRTWQPPEELLAPVDDGALFAQARRAHAGFIVTSYSQVKASGGFVAPQDEADDFKTEAPRTAAPLLADELPGGAASGVFIHEVLERMPLATFADQPDFEAWRAKEEVRRIVDGSAKRHGIEPRHVPHSERLAFAALSAPVPLERGRAIRGLFSAAKVLREMEFLYPIPEEHHPRLGEQLGEALSIERGYVKGFVDLVFEHDGRTYFADWKSDRLPAWTGSVLQRHVRVNYGLQARLYSLAVAKLLELKTARDFEERFGGLLYLFVRGMQPGDEAAPGVHFERPTWADLCAWEDELVRGNIGR